MKTRTFSSDAEIVALVRAFEEKTIPANEFKHAAHVAVALSYLSELPLAPALDRMRENVQAFARHHGTDGLYHETLTVFWMRLLAHLIQIYHVEQPLWQRVNAILERWGNRRPLDAHFSPELIRSSAARSEWTPPDRLPLTF